MTHTLTSIDDYFKKIGPENRKALERIRTIARQVVPDAQEVISYGMPTLQHPIQRIAARS